MFFTIDLFQKHYKFKLQAALKGPSHPGSLQPGGLRKTAKVSNMHLKW